MPSAFLALPTIAERRARIAKTLVIEEAVLSRMANALVEELDFRLVTDAPKMMAAIREAERQTVRFAPQSNPYVPYPRLLFFPYESGNPSLHLLTDRWGGQAFARWLRRLQSRISVEATRDPAPLTIEGRLLPLPDFEALPALEFPTHALIAVIHEHHFYWLGTYHPGDSVKTWWVRARESLRQFPQLAFAFEII
ncbi:MAG: hypothetical protein J6V64_05355 [Burkholderiaceae bacterium]|nr:hypothetical protein [Burkholderiaceae bacterium]